jgi:hypothetical protein
MQVLQEQKPVLITLGIPNMDALTSCVYVADLKA